MARLVLCSSGIPHETRGASLVLFFHYVARLRREGHEILHVLLLEGDLWPDADVTAYRDRFSIEVFPCRSKRFVEQSRSGHRLHREAITAALERVASYRPDALICFDLVPAWAMQPCRDVRRLVWLGDLNFQSIWWHALYATHEDWRNVRYLPGNWLGCRAWERVYREVLRNADQVLVASHSSVAALARLGVSAEYAPYPWPETGKVLAPQPAERPTFLFFGQLGGLGSRSALHFMFEKVYPRLRRRWGADGFRILIAGAGIFPDWAAKLVDGLREVERLGFVDDLGTVMRRCHAALFPIAVPVGNRSRILTAMAYGVPVIAHRNCALGNSALVDGETALLAGDANGFAERMDRVVREPAFARAVAERAYTCYKAQFHPEPAGARLAARVEDLLVKRAAAS